MGPGDVVLPTWGRMRHQTSGDVGILLSRTAVRTWNRRERRAETTRRVGGLRSFGEMVR